VKLYWRRDINETLSSTLEVVLRQVRVPIPQSKVFTRGIQKERTCRSLLFLVCIYPNQVCNNRYNVVTLLVTKSD